MTKSGWLCVAVGAALWMGCYGADNGGGNNTSAGASGADGGSSAAATDDPLFGGPSTCTSGQMVSTTTGDGFLGMNPGQACIACHSTGEGPNCLFAGTVYPTGHEPNNCVSNASSQQLQVVVTDAKGQRVSTDVGESGNFCLRASRRSPITLTMPIHAKVVQGTKERAMGGAQTSGDCNSCHTETGANGAPGRIVAP